MTNFSEISPELLNESPFKLFNKDWALVTAGDINNCNTMTVSWGGVGILWNKNVATIYIRPQRYTYEYIENNELFSICFFDESYKKALSFCGKESGRNCDKIKQCNLTPIEINKTIAFEQAKLILICKKIYKQDISPESFIDENINKHYPEKDYHRMYIGEIVNILKK